MNLKSKLFGTLAASAIALSMSAGIASGDSVSGTAVLEKGVCQFEITEANAHFGFWKYDGTEYVLSSGSNVSTMNYALKAGRLSGTCDLAVTFAGIAGSSGTMNASYFSASENGSTYYALDSAATALAAGYPVSNETPGTGTVYLRLDEVNDKFQPDTYAGTIEVVITNTD